MKKNLYLHCLFFAKIAVTTVIAFIVAINSSLLFAEPISTEKNRTDWPSILILGDSLSASFGIEQSQGWVSLLGVKLTDKKYQLRVINTSISGETTQGGLQRLPALLTKHKPAIVIVELGGNDGLRGLNLSMIKTNLLKMLSTINNTNASPLLIGIRLPPNYGQVYNQRFYQIYFDLSKKEKVPLVPFLLEGVATNESLMQADGIHPTANAQARILENVWQLLQPMIGDHMEIAKY